MALPGADVYGNRRLHVPVRKERALRLLGECGNFPGKGCERIQPGCGKAMVHFWTGVYPSGAAVSERTEFGSFCALHSGRYGRGHWGYGSLYCGDREEVSTEAGRVMNIVRSIGKGNSYFVLKPLSKENKEAVNRETEEK